MATAATYSPVRSAIILTLGFLLPLLVTFYYNRLCTAFATSRFSSMRPYTPRVSNTEFQNVSILAQQQNVGSILLSELYYLY